MSDQMEQTGEPIETHDEYDFDGDELVRVRTVDQHGNDLLVYDLRARTVWNGTDGEDAQPMSDETYAHFMRLLEEHRRRQSIQDAVQQIVTIRDAALADRPHALALQQDALGLSTQIAALAQSIAGFQPGATYRQEDMVAVRNTLAVLCQRQKVLCDAIAEQAGYRAANDEAVVVVYNAVLWLGQTVAGV